jgi:Fe-S-cluster formation regulator IscX/YfhJ
VFLMSVHRVLMSISSLSPCAHTALPTHIKLPGSKQLRPSSPLQPIREHARTHQYIASIPAIQDPDRASCERIVERIQREQQDVRAKWSKIVDTAFESSDAARTVDPDTLNKIKEEVTANPLRQVEGVIIFSKGIRRPERLNDFDI